ncbi:MAG: GGDEF domain-containing protein [Gemmatimonadales bacterium]
MDNSSIPVMKPTAAFGGRDPLLEDAGAHGELLVARIRIVITALLLLIPLTTSSHATPDETMVGVGIALAALLIAIAVWLLVRRDFYRAWLGMLTSSLDVSLVSAALAVFLLLNQPHVAVNSKVIFEAYFLAIGAASLRYDARTCVAAGALALLQYGCIVLYASSNWDLNHPSFAPFPYGMFNWGAQIGRLVILLIAIILSTALVIRARRLFRLSTRDRLTGLVNRGFFDERVVAEVSRAERYGHPLAIAMVDVDHFKRFNDTMGHAAGDAALRAIAECMMASFRRSDIVARYGGEEFVVIMPETTVPQAMEKMEEVRLAVANLSVPVPRREIDSRLTVSAGVAGMPDDGNQTDTLLDAADRRLFRAKEGGRNQVRGALEGRTTPVTSPPAPSQ